MIKYLLYIVFILGAGLLFSSPALAEDNIKYVITGLDGELLKNATSAIKAAERNAFTKNAHLDNERLERLFYQNEQRIRNSLRPFGYFSPTIQDSIDKSKKPWIFKYQVNPGPSVNIGRLKLEIKGPGKTNAAFVKLETDFPLKVGQIFNSKQYTAAKNALFTAASNNGYLQAELVAHSVSIDMANYTANIILKFKTGPQFYFGPVTFTKSALSYSFLQSYVRFKPNQIYSTHEILQLQQNLNSAGYFSRVTVKPRIQPKTSKHVPIQVELSPARTMLYSLSGGYGTDTGYRGGLGWQWRRINSAGHHFNMQLNASQIGNSISSTYSIPGANPVTEQYNLTNNIAYYKTNAGTSSLQSYGFMYSNTKSSWQSNAGLIYQYEKYLLNDTKEKQSAHLFMPTITWMYLFSDKPLKPTKGVRFSLNLRGAWQQVFSDTTFGQFRARLHALLPFNRDNRLFLRLDVGGTSTANYNKLPLSLRFTAGGAQSVRGYGYQSLGPGKYLLTNTIEYQYRVHSNWFVGVFNDTGNAFESIKYPELKSAAGIAGIWESPIGSMELSVARSTSDPKQKIAVQFSMGTLL
jgi:translocation and assembly module TamA